MAQGEAWSRPEVELTIDAYLAMLQAELEGRPYVKTQINRELQRHLEGRTTGAIDFKHGNISAAVLEMGVPYLTGYKPYTNFQGLIRTVLAERLEAAEELRQALLWKSEEPVIRGPVNSLRDILSDPPTVEPTKQTKPADTASTVRTAQRVNWLEKDARNRELGRLGELLALEFEDARLRAAGQHKLANRIVHISETEGDGPGYDILSFESSGQERFIEVKTTRWPKYSPFYASANEVKFSAEQKDRYHLYRLFSFTKKPGLFQLPGALGESCRLEPVTYRASIGL